MNGRNFMNWMFWKKGSQKEKGKSKKQLNYIGKNFSILGDSLSTLQGYNPTGYNLFYEGENSNKSGVIQMHDTWWGKVIEHFHGQLLINNSWSGSRVTKIPSNSQLFPSGCSEERVNGLHINHIKPDVILVYLGTNDWGYGVEPISSVSHLEIFESAYTYMLSKLKENYPKAEIWCCTLASTYMSSSPSFRFPYTYGGIHMKVYNNLIRKCVNVHQAGLIDLYSYSQPYDTIDGSHATADGMNTLAELVIHSMLYT